MYHTYTGHFDVVNCLAVIGDKLFSSSLDATIRQWSLKPTDLQIAVDLEKEKQQQLAPGPDGIMLVENTGKKAPVETEKSMLTEDEERELAEMMEDSD